MDAKEGAALAAVRHALGGAHLRLRRAVATQAVGVARLRAADRAERRGLTVVTVTWKSLRHLETLVGAVRRFSPEDAEILVVDNHSADATSAFLSARHDLRSLRLPVNVGHGLGLDLGVLQADTSHVVVLDVDAFPIADSWLASVLEPLAAGATVAGAHIHRSYVHPCFLGLRRRDFVELGLSFAPIGRAPKLGGAPRGLFMDVGEALSHNVTIARGSNALHRVPLTSVRGPGMLGAVFGGVVYHNFYSTQGAPELIEASQQIWNEAVDTYLG